MNFLGYSYTDSLASTLFYICKTAKNTKNNVC